MSDKMQRPARLLLVEDEALIRMIIVEILRDDGYEVSEASSSSEAASHLTGDTPFFDAAIVDVGLPDRPGDVLVEEIRARFPDLPIVMASGLDGVQLAHRFSGDARIRVVAKPYSEAALYSALAELGIAVPVRGLG